MSTLELIRYWLALISAAYQLEHVEEGGRQ